MHPGEAWWAELDERRLFVLLSGDEAAGFQAMPVVAPATVSLGGLGIEVAVGAPDGLPVDGVLRFGFRRPGPVPCTWLTTLSAGDLIERAGALPAAKLADIEEARRRGEQASDWTPDTAARFSAIRDALRRGELQ
jgi:mRNA interferase MazF